MLGAIGWVEWSAYRLPLRDTPIGTDWPRYLGNAVAIGERRWQDYQLWRGPLHALLCLALSNVAGLLEASQAVSMVAVGAIIAASAALGRRSAGPGHGALTALLLAGWPDLALQARMSTPYPLLAGLVASALLALDHTSATVRPASPPHRTRGLLALGVTGVLFGLAGATDARGMVLAGAAVAGAVCWSPRAVPRLLAALGLALTVRWAVLWRLPVQLLSLGQQIALQRDLHARESRIPTCVDHHAAAVQISELWSPCAAQTAWLNLHRLLPMAPLPIAVIALVALLGVRRRNAPLLGMVLTIVPATLLVGLEHRYLLPLAGPVAVLIGSGVARVGGLMARAPWFATRPGPAARLTPAAALVLTVSMAVGWRLHADTLMARATAGRPAPGPPRVNVHTPPPIAFVRGWLREHAPADARIIDCAGLGLNVRLYPRPVAEESANGRSSARCDRLLASPPAPHVLVLTATQPGDPAWATAMAAAELRVVASD